MVVTGEDEPMPTGRTVRGPPDAWRAVSGDWGGGRRKEALWGRRRVARSSFIVDGVFMPGSCCLRSVTIQ